MSDIIIITYSKEGTAHISVKHSRCGQGRKEVEATKGEKMFRKFGYSPFKKWSKFRERNGGM